MQEFNERIAILPSKERVELLEDSVYKGMAQFRADNEMFKDEHLKQNRMIRRYDEVISEKASRQSLVEQNREQTKQL